MAGIEDLKILLSSMKPELDSREFVFCTFDNPFYGGNNEFNPDWYFSKRGTDINYNNR